MSDHSKERDLSDLVPKWALVRLLSISVSVGAALGSGLFWAWRLNADQRFEAIEKANSDPRWEALANLSQRAGTLEAVSRQHEDRLATLERENLGRKMDRLENKVDDINKRLTRAFGR